MKNKSPFPFAQIVSWYAENGRHDLPWREYHFDEQDRLYRVWLSEIMLQQTQASRVVDYFHRCIETFPNIGSLARASWDDFFPIYEGLGYYRRGRNMLTLAQKVMHEHDGLFPTDIEALKTLPGIGPYTAAAICAFALDQPILSFDTNLNKIFARYIYGDRRHTLTQKDRDLLINELLSSGISGRDINNALMDFGALVSHNQRDKVDWETYPIKTCMFYETRGHIESKHAPISVKKRLTPKDQLTIIVHVHKDHTVYYSANPDTYTPFMLPKTPGDHRHYIQNWFQEKYDITLSVRPAFERNTKEIKYYAQIQRGKSDDFGAFTAQERKNIENEEGLSL